MFGVGSLAIAILGPLVSAEIINSLASKQWLDFRYYLFLLILILVFQVIVSFAIQWIFLLIDEGLANNLRRKIVAEVLRKEYPFFESHWVGDIISRAVNDSTALKPFLTSGVLQILVDALTLIVVTVILLRMHPVLGLLTISTAPITIFYGRRTQPTLVEATRLTREKIAALTGKLQSWLTRIFSIKIHSLEKIALSQFSTENDELTSKSIKLGLWGATLGAINATLITLPSLLIFGYGGYITLSGRLSVGELFAFITFAGYFNQPIQRLIQIIVVNLPMLYAVYERVRELLEPDSDQNIEDAGEIPNRIECLRASGLQFQFRKEKQYHLRVSSFFARRGEITAISGPNGSGKSTLARLLAGIYEPEEGEIKILLEDETDLVVADRRKLFAYISQSPDLFDGTLRDNVTLYDQAPDMSRLRVLEKDLELEMWISSLEKEWDTEINGGLTARLSGGQIQKIALARLLYSDCPVLLLDEPSKNLDSEAIELLRSILTKGRQARIIILITHSTELLELCDRVYRLIPIKDQAAGYECVEEK